MIGSNRCALETIAPVHARWRAHAPPLAVGDVHLWRLSLEPPARPLDLLLRSFSPDELQRAGQYVFQRDHDHFVVARGLLRAILAAYISVEPGEIQFGYGPHGKPRLAGMPAGSDLTFNLSHTRGLGLLAVARGRELGVDIEQIRPEVDILGIARSTFSAAEQAAIEALPPADRVTAFFTCWTRKEAYIKARGAGLSYPLTAFDVSLKPGEPAAILRSAEGSDEVRRWAVVPVDVPAGFAASLVVEAPLGRLWMADWR